MTDIRATDLVAYDVESTGLEIGKDRIVEFGASMFNVGKMTGRGGRKVDPGMPIPSEASDIHGIMDEDVKGCDTFDIVLPRIAKQFDSSSLLVGYNCLRFDDAMINAEAERVGSDWRMPTDKVLDLIVFVNWYHRGERPRTQTAIGEKLYGVKPKDGAAHSAAVDTQMTGELCMAMVRKGIIPWDLDAALIEQARLRPVIEREFDDWGPWLYRDRGTQRLRVGAGKHCGKQLTDVPKGTLSWYMSNIDDLPDQTRRAFSAAKEGLAHEEIQESMFEGSADSKSDVVDDVAGWGG